MSSTVAAIWLDVSGQADLSLAGRAASQLGLWVGLAGSAVVASRLKGSGRIQRDFGMAFDKSDVLRGVIAGMACQFLVFIIALLAQPLLGQPDVSGKTKELVQRAEGLGLVALAVFIVFVVVGAPLVEELFFRGLVLRSIQRRFGAAWAVALSGILFGLAHVQDLPAEGLVLTMVSLAAVGVVFGVLAVRTGRLGSAVVAHFTFNAFTSAYLLSLR